MDFPKQHVEALWAPWRVEYYAAEHGGDINFFEQAASASNDAEHLVVARGKSTFLIMNKYPYASGHLMVAPYRQIATMEDLTEDEAMELWRFCLLGQKLLKKVVHAQGFNIGVNLGSAAGAGYADHLHFHIVPRWNGDSNFMATIGNTRILPEALRPLYERLIAARDESQPLA